MPWLTPVLTVFLSLIVVIAFRKSISALIDRIYLVKFPGGRVEATKPHGGELAE